jgi:hypothetical protein
LSGKLIYIVAGAFAIIKQNRAWSLAKMTATAALSAALCRRILRRFSLPLESPPSLDTLRQLLARYTRTAPWESASRIARRARHEAAADCALLGADFWASHFGHRRNLLRKQLRILRFAAVNGL